MLNKRSFLPIFFIFFCLSGIVFFLSSHNILFGENILENTVFPIQSLFFKLGMLPQGLLQNNDLVRLQQENRLLHGQLVHMQQVQQDNAALRDQFETTTISSSVLLPTEVIGEGQFFPGISAPETLTLNKGVADGISIGDSVIFETNLLGSISQIADHASLVTLASNRSTSFTAKTSGTSAQGVLTGQGNGVMVLGNVVLSDSLKVGDLVITTGSQDISGKGISPGLIVGKIISVQKNPSSLYQSASVESLLQIGKLTTVFIEK